MRGPGQENVAARRRCACIDDKNIRSLAHRETESRLLFRCFHGVVSKSAAIVAMRWRNRPYEYLILELRAGDCSRVYGWRRSGRGMPPPPAGRRFRLSPARRPFRSAFWRPCPLIANFAANCIALGRRGHALAPGVAELIHWRPGPIPVGRQQRFRQCCRGAAPPGVASPNCALFRTFGACVSCRPRRRAGHCRRDLL